MSGGLYSYRAMVSGGLYSYRAMVSGAQIPVGCKLRKITPEYTWSCTTRILNSGSPNRPVSDFSVLFCFV